MGKLYQHSKIVIGVPVFNEHQYIIETLNSLKKQTYEDYLVVISDNNSSDGTVDTVSEFCLKDKRFQLQRQQNNIGALRNMEFLLENSNSEYFMWMGGHDRLHPQFLEYHLSVLDNQPVISLSYSHIRRINEQGKEITITEGGQLAEINYESSLKRYLCSINKIRECTAINHIFRRKCLYGFKFNPVAGIDHIALSRLLYCGRFNVTNKVLYERRYIDNPDTSYMERITGKKESSKKSKDYIKTKRAYIQDYLSIPIPFVKKLYFLPLVFLSLDKQFDLGIYWVKSKIIITIRSIAGHINSQQ